MNDHISTIAVVNGPNLASLGLREPSVYGDVTAVELTGMLGRWASENGFGVEFTQSDTQGGVVAAVQEADAACSALLINPGAFSHTSVAVLDAMRAFHGPVVEVHISQVFKREPYRHRMLTARAAQTVISGAGLFGYYLGILAIKELLRR